MRDLISEIRSFCEAHNMAPTRFGELALNDKPLVSQIEKGRRLWPETEARVIRFMETYKPEASQDAA